MSSVRTERRLLQPRTPLIPINPRLLASVVMACAGLFALSFAAGRALSPGHVRSEALPEFAATQASAAIPVSLSAAPTLKLGTPVAAVVHTRRAPAPTTQRTTLATAQSLPVLTSQTPTPPATTPTSTPAPVITPAPKAPVHTPASTRTSGGSRSKHGGGGGIFFDSSG